MTPQKADGKDWEQEALRKSRAWIWDDLYMKSITDTEQVSLISRALNLFGNHLLGLAEQHFRKTIDLLSDGDMLMRIIHKNNDEISRLKAEQDKLCHVVADMQELLNKEKADRQRMIKGIIRKLEDRVALFGGNKKYLPGISGFVDMFIQEELKSIIEKEARQGE